MGVKDLQYQGNVARPEWPGCPPEALAKLGVAYGPEHEHPDTTPSPFTPSRPTPTT
jgi:hypothetical protein